MSREFSETLLRAAVAHRHRRARPRRTVVAVAVASALLLAGAAFAAVKLGMLSGMLKDAGLDDATLSNVQQLDAVHAGDRLRAELGEALWEGGDLYVSFEASVPDDGNTYLLALSPPMRDGEMVDFGSIHYLHHDSPTAYALGGGGPTELSILLQLGPSGREPMTLSMGATLLRCEKPVAGVSAAEYYENISREIYGELQRPEDDDTLYYLTWAGLDAGARSLYLNGRQDVRDYVDRAEIAYADAHQPADRIGTAREEVDCPADLIGPEMFEELGIGEIVERATLSAALSPGVEGAKTVARSVVRAEGFTAKVRSFAMSHVALDYHVELFSTGGRVQYDTLMPLSADGRALSARDSCFMAQFVSSDAQSGGVSYECEFDGIYPSVPDRILLVPADIGSDGEPIYHMDAAIELSLVAQ